MPLALPLGVALGAGFSSSDSDDSLELSSLAGFLPFCAHSEYRVVSISATIRTLPLLAFSRISLDEMGTPFFAAFAGAAALEGTSFTTFFSVFLSAFLSAFFVAFDPLSAAIVVKEGMGGGSEKG